MARALRPLAFALLCLIWGSTWLAIKVGYGDMGPFEVAAWRFAIAGLVLVPIALVWQRLDAAVRWPRGRTEWMLVAFVAAILFAADYGLIYWGEQFLDSSLTAVLFAVMPISTAFFAHLYVPGERLTVRKFGGTLVAFLGVAALFADRLAIDASKALPMLAILGSTVCAAAASVATKRHGGGLHPATMNAPAMMLGALLLALASLATGEPLSLPRQAGVWWSIGYLALAGSIVTFLIYFWLLKTWQATTMSFIAVFTPLVAIALGLLIDETPTPWMAAGTALILGGVALALTGGKHAREEKALEPARG